MLTFGGHPVAAAAAIKNLDTYDDENLVEKARKWARISALVSRSCARIPPSVMSWRRNGLGHRACQEQEGQDALGQGSCVDPPLDRQHGRGLDHAHGGSDDFAPPPAVTREEVDRIVAAADESLTKAEQESRAKSPTSHTARVIIRTVGGDAPPNALTSDSLASAALVSPKQRRQ